MPDLETLRQGLARCRREIRNLQVMQMRPGQSFEQVAFLHQLERSERAEAALRQKAIDHQMAVETGLKVKK